MLQSSNYILLCKLTTKNIATWISDSHEKYEFWMLCAMISRLAHALQLVKQVIIKDILLILWDSWLIWCYWCWRVFHELYNEWAEFFLLVPHASIRWLWTMQSMLFICTRYCSHQISRFSVIIFFLCFYLVEDLLPHQYKFSNTFCRQIVGWGVHYHQVNSTTCKWLLWHFCGFMKI